MVRRRYSRPLRPFLLCVHTRTAKDELTKLVQCFPVGHAVGDRRALTRALIRAAYSCALPADAVHCACRLASLVASVRRP
jgi:hypothetical protein